MRLNINDIIDKNLKTVRDKIIATILTVSGTGIVLCVFFIGFSHWPITESYLHAFDFNAEGIAKYLIYGCIGLFAIVLGIERRGEMAKMKRNIEDQTSAMKTLSENITEISRSHENIVYNLNILSARVELKNHVDFPDGIEDAINRHVPKDLHMLFRKEFNDYAIQLSNAIKAKKATTTVRETFSRAYRKWLEENPRSTVYATSSPSSKYYWTTENESNTPIEDSIVEFISRGGNMHRIFFVTEEDMKDSDVISRLNKQVKFGVKVFLSKLEKGAEQNTFFIIDKDKHLTFRIYADRDKSMSSYSCSVDENYHRRFLTEWETLLEKYNTSAYRPLALAKVI